MEVMVPPQDQGAAVLAHGRDLLALVDQNQVRRWFHAAHTNLVTFNTVFLEMRCVLQKDDIANLEVIGTPGVSGQAGSAQWLLSWEVFATCNRDNNSTWAVEAWSLYCPKGQLPLLRPWQVYVKRMHELEEFWPAPPAPPRGRNRRRRPPDEDAPDHPDEAAPDRAEAHGLSPVAEEGEEAEEAEAEEEEEEEAEEEEEEDQDVGMN